MPHPSVPLDDNASSDTVNRQRQDQSSDIAQKVQSLLKFASELSAHEEVEETIALITDTAALRGDLRRKAGEVDRLHARIKTMEEAHKTTCAQHLQTYESSQEQLRARLQHRESETRDLKNVLKEKLSVIEALKRDETRQKHETAQLQEALGLCQENASKDAAIVQDLKTLQTKTQQEILALRKQLQNKNAVNDELQATLRNSQQDFEKLSRDHSWIQQQWRQAQSLTTEMNDEDPKDL